MLNNVVIEVFKRQEKSCLEIIEDPKQPDSAKEHAKKILEYTRQVLEELSV